VLSRLPEVRVCTAYRYEGKLYEDFPPHQSIFHKAEAVYQDMEGWSEELGKVRTFGDLPPAARKYVDRITELGGVPVRNLSVGPSREQTLEVEAA
jgi:adenylosuccinate synthase